MLVFLGKKVNPHHSRRIKLTISRRQVVRRDHLHSGLTESARQHGVNLVTGMKVCDLSYVRDGIRLETTSGKIYAFDLVVGADGIRSFVRQTLFPNIVPKAPSKVAAYRGVLSYDKIFAEVPEARAYLRNSMDVWIGNSGYILTYPISGGKELNIVTAFCKDDYVTKMENVDIDEFRGYYKDYSPIIKQILGLVGYTQRWPLLQMPPMKSWSNDTKNVVLLGDAVHCMQNHMAQGAATAMEDGAFLGAVIGEVVRGVVSICEAVEIYEKRRMPKAWIKQQISFTSGLVNMATGQMARDRDVASKPEIDAHYHNPVASPALSPTYRSWQYFCNPTSVPGVFYYDAEGDADNAICEYLQGKGEVDDLEMLSTGLKNKWMGYVTDNGLRDTKEDANFHRELNEADYARHGKGL